MQTALFPLVDLESVARKSCSLWMSKVGLGSSMVGKGIGVSSCLRVSSTSSLVERFGVGVPWESCSFVGAPLAISYLGASLLPARAAGSLVIQGTNLVARGARERSLKEQMSKVQDGLFMKCYYTLVTIHVI